MQRKTMIEAGPPGRRSHIVVVVARCYCRPGWLVESNMSNPAKIHPDSSSPPHDPTAESVSDLDICSLVAAFTLRLGPIFGRASRTLNRILYVRDSSTLILRTMAKVVGPEDWTDLDDEAQRKLLDKWGMIVDEKRKAFRADPAYTMWSSTWTLGARCLLECCRHPGSHIFARTKVFTTNIVPGHWISLYTSCLRSMGISRRHM